MAFSFANACDDIGGVPSWQRCETVFGTPAPDWSEVVPLAIGLGVGAVIWYLLGLIPSGKGEEGA